MKKLLAAAAALSGALALTNAAMAADSFVADPVYDWTGPYLGLQGGYGWGETEVHNIPTVPTTGIFDIEGFTGGVETGYNYQVEQFVFGIETDISLSGIDGSTTNNCALCSTDIEWFGTVRARAGFAFERVLIFASGGLAYGEVDSGFSSASANHNSEVNVGWTAGGGLEWAATDQFSVKAEYLFMDIGTVDIQNFVRGHAEDTHIARVGLNWHF
jgi:outer membrane immunogenic protein